MSLSASEVSVVTVNWNGRERLEELLPSLSPLGCREILVVDNASQDGSQEFVRSRHPGVRLLENPLNQGFAQPCNRGAQEASGRAVAFINNDMRADPQWIAAAAARVTPQTPCVGSRILDWNGQRVDFNGSSLQYLGYALQKDIGKLVEQVTHEERILFPCGGAMLIDREVFLRTGGFDEDFFAIFEDVDLGWRLWIAGYEVAFAPDSVVFHRGHATFQTQPNEKMRYLMHRNALLTILKNYGEEAFRKILPLAVVLAVKRAVHFSGADKESFYLWGNQRQRLQTGDAAAQNQLLDALNHLVAVEDVLDSLPSLLAKRRAVQSARRRGDEEIVGLFGDPLRAIVEDPEYLDSELQFLECLELDSLFDLPSRPRRAASLSDQLQGKILRLRRELTALQWSAGRLAGTPADSAPPPRLSTFLDIWRRDGWRQAWRRLVERVDRGI